MNKELIMKSDVLDILFENRNKGYGAYDLRKFYASRLLKAIGIMIGVVVVLSAFTFLPKKKETSAEKKYTVRETIITALKEPEKKPEIPKEPAKPFQPVQKRSAGSPLIVEDNLVKDSIQISKPTDGISNVTITSPGIGGFGPDKPLVIGGGTDNPDGAVKKPVDKTNPISNPDIMPSYPGGTEALRRFLQKNLNNPKDMQEGEVANVMVRFVVGYDGKLQSFVTVQNGGDEFNREVIRVLKKMPDWIPGKSNGENVSVYYNIPVKFVPAE